MLLLCLDSSAAASTAVVVQRDDRPQVAARWETADTRSHAEVLTPAVQEVLRTAGALPRCLDGIVVGTGPGPFTGLRVGLVTARTLAHTWNLPVYGLCSLSAIAHDVAALPSDSRPDRFVVATDARRREVYWAEYSLADPAVRGDLSGPAGAEHDGVPRAELVSGPHVGPAEDLPSLPVYGRGAGLYADRLADAVARPVPGAQRSEPPTEWQPTAASLGLATLALARAGGVLPTDTAPLYLRESDAKVPGPRKRAGA